MDVVIGIRQTKRSYKDVNEIKIMTFSVAEKRIMKKKNNGILHLSLKRAIFSMSAGLLLLLRQGEKRNDLLL